MKIRNPYYVDPTVTAAEALKAAITAHLQANPAKAVVTLAELKAAVPAVNAAPRQVVNAALQLLNIQTDEDGQ